MSQLALPIATAERHQAAATALTALEDDTFPFEHLSEIAEHESWRKEVYRPVYHVHKWWAQRLGSVFRAIIMSALSPSGTDVMEKFYSPARFPEATVFDPFMGSGTTAGEALKLGCRAIGRDINPVAYFAVRNALEPHSPSSTQAAFDHLSRTVRPEIEHYYRCKLPSGEPAISLYFFWVKVVPCPSCESDVDLFSSYIFSRHAYAKRYPEGKVVCPYCGEVSTCRVDAATATCTGCKRDFDPHAGPAQGTLATCPCCTERFKIAGTIRKLGHPPGHRMYAKMALTKAGEKVYLRTDAFDQALYDEAAERLSCDPGLYPISSIEPGYNTNQALNYGYRHWHEMFNARQLLCLGLLAREICSLHDPAARDAMACLFSGTLEFNNMFASFKGEGTGAVRHMFSHHILKPERVPLEANPWGTPKSSGSFSTLYKSRLLRAQEYCADPFELCLTEGRSGKAFGLSVPIGQETAKSHADFAGKRLYLSCGDSANTDIPDQSVDLIVTDPPFFDNVNYSQLADFFYVWQRHMLAEDERATTRSEREVQHQDAKVFASRLGGVFAECHRVLTNDGLLAFTYHHSRGEGWSSVLSAIMEAGFKIVATQPVKAEMSVAQPKQQAKEPIDLDIIIVCRKRVDDEEASAPAWSHIRSLAGHQVQRFAAVGRRLSRNDIRIIVTAQVIRAISGHQLDEALDLLKNFEPAIEEEIERLHLVGGRT